MVNSPITALVQWEERSPQQLVLHGLVFHLSLSFVLPHLKAVNYWSPFWMVMKKPIIPVLKGMSHQGELGGIPFQPQQCFHSSPSDSFIHPWALLVPCRVPPLCEEPEVFCIFSFPLPSPWFCILALNPEINFTFFFPDTSKQNPPFSGNDTLSHTWFWENTNLSALASVILVTIFLHKA